jgi:hypothetical protein
MNHEVAFWHTPPENSGAIILEHDGLGEIANAKKGPSAPARESSDE